MLAYTCTGRTDAADPVLPPLPQAAVAGGAVQEYADQERAHQHPQRHGRGEETQANILDAPKQGLRRLSPYRPTD